MRRRRLLQSAGAGLASLALPRFSALAEESTIRIGLLHDLSGPFAGAGSVPLSIGAQLAIDYVNGKGGIGGKVKVVPVSADSQSKADVAINEAERLLNQEKVDIILGVYSSAHAVPLAAKVDEQKKILWINSAIATAVLKDRHYKYVFRPTTHSDAYAVAAISFVSENAKSKLGSDPKDLKIALIDEDGPYGTGVQTGDENESKKQGVGSIVLKESYSASAPDLSSLITKLKRARPDVIIHAGYNPDITLFLRQAREAGLRFKALIGNGAGYSQLDKLRETFGEDVDNFFNIDPAPAQILSPSKLGPGVGDLIKIMVDGYKAKTKATEVPTHCSMGFNNTWILLDKVLPVAASKYGGFSPDAIRQAALDVDVPLGGTLQGYGVKFAPPTDVLAGQNLRAVPVVMQNRGKDITVVWPSQIASAEPVMPLPASSPYAMR
ncbi:MAG TPA: ABC transporter substrate-binding protein [Stellaceae bacterium]|jgi:branched-chain amino acid transport system substrate-binding protein|nr:ABC transporter substrate-binding protein [Stellaceae bacterium]